MSTKNVLEQIIHDLPGEAKVIIVVDEGAFHYRVDCPVDSVLQAKLTTAMDEVQLQLANDMQPSVDSDAETFLMDVSAKPFISHEKTGGIILFRHQGSLVAIAFTESYTPEQGKAELVYRLRFVNHDHQALGLDSINECVTEIQSVITEGQSC